ncbi:MAG: hypothetical protein AB1Z55_02750 [Acidimicrobiia bacterium]
MADAPVLTCEVLVVGAGLPGLAVAGDARRAGVRDVIVIDVPEIRTVGDPPPVEIIGGIEVERIDASGDHVVVDTSDGPIRARVAIDTRPLHARAAEMAIPVAPEVAEYVHGTPDGFEVEDRDVLVVGGGERAISDAAQLVADGARVVLAFTGPFEGLASAARSLLAALEHAGYLTVLWYSVPTEIVALGDEMMAAFDDRRTPDLVFDHVVCADPVELEPGEGRVVVLGSPGFSTGEAWAAISRGIDPALPAPQVLDRIPARHPIEVERLRAQHYNAVITSFDHAHGDLWVLRIRPDRPATAHAAGQYATLGLGAWEPRADTAEEGRPVRADKMIRRSYSISSRILDDRGWLVDPRDEDEIELYVVHVRPDGDNIPQLTPRLALKRPGDRVYLGPKVTGRYTLRPVRDPTDDVVLLGTGTGEAPHNAMTGELLRRGHTGAIVHAVSVRYRDDLGYEATHRVLEARFPNYRYVPLVTREEDTPKRYVQDLLRDGDLVELLPHGFDPDRTHVFLCGNPAMIGPPTWDGDVPTFPEPVGACELLHEQGFTLDRRTVDGNVHFEEYW